MSVQKTERGTEIVSGVERSSPPPPFALKAMERRWAEELVRYGRLRLSSFQYYMSLEDNELGDRAEGDGRYVVGDGFAHMGCAFPVYLFCTSLPEVDLTTLLALQDGYDAVVRVNEIEEFARIVRNAAQEQHGLVLLPYVGPVIYDRDQASTFGRINAMPWAWNAFQKDARYAHQREYRFAFQHNPTIRVDRPKTEEEHRAELLRKHLSLQLALKPGILEIQCSR